MSYILCVCVCIRQICFVLRNIPNNLSFNKKTCYFNSKNLYKSQTLECFVFIF